MKSTEQIIEYINTLAKEAVDRAVEETSDEDFIREVIEAATSDIKSVDSDQFKDFSTGAAKTAIKLGYLELDLVGEADFKLYSLFGDTEGLFKAAIDQVSTTRTQHGLMVDALLEVGIGIGLIEDIRTEDGRPDMPALVDIYEFNPLELAEQIIGKFKELQSA